MLYDSKPRPRGVLIVLEQEMTADTLWLGARKMSSWPNALRRRRKTPRWRHAFELKARMDVLAYRLPVSKNHEQRTFSMSRTYSQWVLIELSGRRWWKIVRIQVVAQPQKADLRPDKAILMTKPIGFTFGIVDIYNSTKSCHKPPSLFAWIGHWIFHPVSYVVPSVTRTWLEEYIPPATWAPRRQAEEREVG